jgi:hypothetical protein
LAESVPHAEPLQPAPESAQVTPLFCESFWTVAVKAWDCSTVTDWLAGETATLIGGGGAVTVTVALAVFVLSVTDVAVKVTVAGLGTVAGAVYVMGAADALELAESAPQAVPVQPEPESAQVTPLFCESF